LGQLVVNRRVREVKRANARIESASLGIGSVKVIIKHNLEG
jgi:hypothetical protein